MKLNRRSLFGRIAVAIGLPSAAQALPPSQLNQWVAARPCPPVIHSHETAFGTVTYIKSAFLEERQQAIERLKQDMDRMLLGDESAPLSPDAIRRRAAETPEWMPAQS